jgi:hypothetical protein
MGQHSLAYLLLEHFASVAQLVEHRFRKAGVAGSILATGSVFKTTWTKNRLINKLKI